MSKAAEKTNPSRATLTETPWYADGLSFTCTQCGNCCTGPPGYVWFNDEEAKAMAEHLGLDEIAFRAKYARRKYGRWTLDEIRNAKGEYDCVFLKRDSKGKALCGIYEVRPQQCRTWPFWPENIRSEAAWQQTAETCPGMNTGKLYPVEQVRIIRDQTPSASDY